MIKIAACSLTIEHRETGKIEVERFYEDNYLYYVPLLSYSDFESLDYTFPVIIIKITGYWYVMSAVTGKILLQGTDVFDIKQNANTHAIHTITNQPVLIMQAIDIYRNSQSLSTSISTDFILNPHLINNQQIEMYREYSIAFNTVHPIVKSNAIIDDRLYVNMPTIKT